MHQFFKLSFFILLCLVLTGCLMWGTPYDFTVEGEVVNTHGKPLNGCTFDYVSTDLTVISSIFSKPIHINSKFNVFGMDSDPIKALSYLTIEIDCGEGYRVYRSSILISYKTLSIDLGRIVIYSQDETNFIDRRIIVNRP